MDSRSPCWAANNNGVKPSLVRAWKSAPCSTNSHAAVGCLSASAHITAVSSCRLSLAFTFAPAASSAFTAVTLPVCAQRIRAVSPESTAAFGFALAFSSLPTMAALPFSHASISGAAP